MWPIGLIASTWSRASRPIGTPTASAKSARRLKLRSRRRSHQMATQLTATAASGAQIDQFKFIVTLRSFFGGRAAGRGIYTNLIDLV